MGFAGLMGGMLEHLRVLDLTDDRGLVAGRLLADLGADVVQLEPFGGSSARWAAPVVAGTDRSMFWETYAAGKRGVCLDLDTEGGRAAAEQLLVAADVFLTSLPSAWLEARDLSPGAVGARHPGLVYTVISPFGLSGPKAGFHASDLVVWAAGGPLDPHREADRPPLRISVAQAFVHAGGDAAAGTLLALRARRRTGTGQLVDISAQQSLTVATLGRALADAVGDANPAWHQQPKAGPPARTDQSGSGASTPPGKKKWTCVDGIIELHLAMGPASGGFTNRFVEWMHDEGACPAELTEWDWRTLPARIEAGEITDEQLAHVRQLTAAFLAVKTKEQVLAAAVQRRLLCVGISDIADLTANAHLAERGFFVEVGEGERALRIPGRWAQVIGAPAPSPNRPAPRLGEHTDEVLAQWCGALVAPGVAR